MTSNRWLILFVLFLARAAMSFQFQTIGAVGPLLIDRLHIDFTWFGTLMGLYMLPGAIVSLPSSVLCQRFGAKQIVLVSLALMVLCYILQVNFAPELFIRKGYSAASAGAIVSLIGWGTMPLVPLADSPLND